MLTMVETGGRTKSYAEALMGSWKGECDKTGATGKSSKRRTQWQKGKRKICNFWNGGEVGVVDVLVAEDECVWRLGGGKSEFGGKAGERKVMQRPLA